MNGRSVDKNGNKDKAMSEEQFEEIVSAILGGKYSWACVLILRFAGYNPLHYIPYRTYNRLIKDNCLNNRSNQEKKSNAQKKFKNSCEEDGEEFPGACYDKKIRDLSYLEEADKKVLKIAGGFRYIW
jgi:hypothetical protein